MAKKEIIKVKLDRKRLEIAMRHMAFSYKSLSILSGVSDTSIRRGAKKGEINKEFAIKIADALCTTLCFLSGDKALDKVAKAIEITDAFYDASGDALTSERE